MLLDAVWLRDAGVLVLTAHVLALDPASWRIVLGELDAGLARAGAGPTSGTGAGAHQLSAVVAAAHRAGANASTPAITGSPSSHGDDPDLGARRVRPQTDRVGDVAVTVSTTDRGGDRPAARRGAGRSRICSPPRQRGWSPSGAAPRPGPACAPLLALETHGRADTVTADADTSDTVGLLSAIYPLRVPSAHARDIGDAIDAIPGDGIDYGLLRYLRADTAERLRAHPEPQLLLNYPGPHRLRGRRRRAASGSRAARRRVGAARARCGGALRADDHRGGARRR